MKKKKAQPKTRDTYQQVTDYVIQELEKGVVPWRQPWGEGIEIAGPQNLVSKRAYQGWNFFYLRLIVRAYKFSTPFFLTFKQAMAQGGSIKKGSHGFPVVCWLKREFKKTQVDGETGEEKIKAVTRLVPVEHIVFNLDQAEGIMAPKVTEVRRTPAEKIAACEAVVSSMPEAPSITEGGDRAFYNRLSDHVQMPPFDSFGVSQEYYSTLFHELVHSTGHKKRLNRAELMESDGFGSAKYSNEELTAEFGAAFLCAHTAIEQKTIGNSVAYIQNWMGRLRADKTLVLKAAAKAQAAADFILGKRQPAQVEPGPARKTFA